MDEVIVGEYERRQINAQVQRVLRDLGNPEPPLKLEDVRTAQFPSFDEVKDKVKQQMEQVKLQEYQESLRKAAKTDYKFANEQPPQAPAAPAKK